MAGTELAVKWLGYVALLSLVALLAWLTAWAYGWRWTAFPFALGALALICGSSTTQRGEAFEAAGLSELGSISDDVARHKLALHRRGGGGMKLSDAKIGPAIAVSDMSRAKEFYESKLGLSGGEEQGDGGTTYPCGEGTSIHVFPSPSASASGATVAGWEVDDLDATVDGLTSNGVSFEQYDQGEMKTNEKGIADLGDAKAAWCKDPDGNVLGILEYAS